MSNHKRSLAWAGALVCILAAAAPVFAATTLLGFRVGTQDAPRAPRLILAARPEMTVVPGSAVVVVENPSYDLFRYRGSYYLMNDGYWYRSNSASGPFVVVDVRSVPRQVLRVPDAHWKNHPHGGPPGQMKKAQRTQKAKYRY